MKYYTFTDIGLGRSRNEDAIAVYDASAYGANSDRETVLFAVADGIGGNGCGDIASGLACRRLKQFFDQKISEFDATRLARRIEELKFDIDRGIRRRGEEVPGCEDMGSTLSVLLSTRSFGVMAHVGDSRIYRLRNGRLSQLTCDQTFVQEMIDEGELSPEQAATHPFRNVLAGGRRHRRASGKSRHRYPAPSIRRPLPSFFGRPPQDDFKRGYGGHHRCARDNGGHPRNRQPPTSPLTL